jgi:NADPH2:quinone reductase
VNPVDYKIRSGRLPSIASPFPAVLHGDVSGIIIELGPNVTLFKVGDEVYGCSGGVKGIGGALAEYMVADVLTIAKKPKFLSLAEAAALPLVTIAAWIALFYKLNLKAGQHILIHGGVGGVGSIAIQLAKSAGAVVSTTVGADSDFATARALGAQGVINYRREPVADYVKRLSHEKGFDVIFDTVGETNLLNSFQAAASNGSIVTTNSRVSLDLTLMHQKALSLHLIFMLLPLLKHQNRQEFQAILTRVAQLVDSGKLKPLIDSSRFSITEVAQAHSHLESGKAKGKVIISWD